MITRDGALELLHTYNKEPFHIRHALTVEQVMRWYARDQGYGEEADHWGLVGLLHDVDFEMFPQEHCLKAPELLAAAGVPEGMVRSICSHGWGLTGVEIAPEHPMEKILYAADELTGIIFAATLMRPSRSARDMELKSLKKKFKDKAFAAGCSREVIAGGAERLGWPLEQLMEKTLQAMRESEEDIERELSRLIGSGGA